MVADKTEHDGSEDHGDGKHAGEGHVCGSGVGKTDHADRRGKKKEEPARSFGAVNLPGKPSHGEGGKKSGYSTGQACGGFIDAEDLET